MIQPPRVKPSRLNILLLGYCGPLNFVHGVAQAWESGKLFHIDLNDQMPGRYDQDLRFGSANPKAAFWLVKFLEDVGI